ncbi:MAG TPA: pantoate--beta-alanine ligase [Xanthobacteraceae bacterium]|nr:pantoate--beta-alanine ligase [Xanthobacteraceae bacterium]
MTAKPRIMRPRIVRSVKALRTAVASLRSNRRTIALVPTMGALHDGHIALVRFAREKADRVAASIFVNPTQFGPTEDFGRYPRTWKADIRALAKERTDLIFAPDVKTIYPDGFATRIIPEGPARAGLEDRFRPHFFAGVATVVAKLLIEATPDIAIFGEKDYQQLLVIRRMALDLDLPVKIVGHPVVREHDGLAYSSRNAYLTPAERETAPVLYRALKETAAAIKKGERVMDALLKGRDTIEAAGFALDYFEARNAETLETARSRAEGPLRLLVAAKLGNTRLIDNIGFR